ncbi:hypothetical protein ABK040_000631 [Willaertia magna]
MRRSRVVKSQVERLKKKRLLASKAKEDKELVEYYLKSNKNLEEYVALELVKKLNLLEQKEMEIIYSANGSTQLTPEERQKNNELFHKIKETKKNIVAKLRGKSMEELRKDHLNYILNCNKVCEKLKQIQLENVDIMKMMKMVSDFPLFTLIPLDDDEKTLGQINTNTEDAIIRVNLPPNEENYESGNGEGAFCLVSKKVGSIYNSNEDSYKTCVGLLQVTPIYKEWCHLKLNDPVIFRFNGDEKRPIAYPSDKQFEMFEKYNEKLKQQSLKKRLSRNLLSLTTKGNNLNDIKSNSRKTELLSGEELLALTTTKKMFMSLQWQNTTYEPILTKELVEEFNKQTEKQKELIEKENLVQVQKPNKPCFLLKNVLTHEECKKIIELCEKKGFEDAESYCFAYRDRFNDRLLTDDLPLTDIIYERCKDHLPTNIKFKHRSLQLDGLNSRLRICKYRKDHVFGPHTDGTYKPMNDRSKTSVLTFLLYLNSKDKVLDDEEGYKGGSTIFYENDMKTEKYRVDGKVGSILFFLQEDTDMIHAGEKIYEGIKYIIRTDVMYSSGSKSVSSTLL